jgi:enamine deaminase RidA (YjgF/YER057c/UK114 family)
VITAERIALVSGQVALDTDGKVVGPGYLTAQTRQSALNLGRILVALRADCPTWAPLRHGSRPAL